MVIKYFISQNYLKIKESFFKFLNIKFVILCFLLFLYGCINNEAKAYKKKYNNEVRLISVLDDESIHQVSILKEVAIGGPSWVDGFMQTRSGNYYSKNNTGVMNYFVKEINIDTKNLNFNFIKLSSMVDAKNLGSSFKPMGIGLECQITYVDNTKNKILVNIEPGTYANRKFSNEIIGNKEIKTLKIIGYHRGKTATGEVSYKDIKIELIDKKIGENIITLDDINYYKIDINSISNKKFTNIISMQKSNLLEGFFVESYNGQLKKMNLVYENDNKLNFYTNSISFNLFVDSKKDLLKLTIDNIKNKNIRQNRLFFLLPINTEYIDFGLVDRMRTSDMKNQNYLVPKKQPWISSDNIGLSHKFNETTNYTFSYNNKLKTLVHKIDLGVYEEINYSTVFYIHQNISNIRNIIDTHIKDISKEFATSPKVTNSGLFMFFGKDTLRNLDPSLISQFGYHETDPGYDDTILQFNFENNISSYDYFEPHTWWLKIPQGARHKITINDIFKDVEKKIDDNNYFTDYFISRQRAKGWITSKQLDKSGNPYIETVDYEWASGYGLFTNPDPDIASRKYGNFYKEWIKFVIDRLSKPERPHAGFFVDSVAAYTKKDYNKEHFKKYTNPLSLDEEGSLFVDTRQSISKLLKKLQNELANKELMVNGAAMDARFIPYTDVVIEETASYLTEELFGRIRSVSLQKPIASIFTGEYSKENIQKLINLNLSYGIFITPSTAYWRNKEYITRDKKLYLDNIFLIKSLNKAKWQPITLAESTQDVRIERFGSKGDKKLYFSIYARKNLEDIEIFLDDTLSKYKNASILNRNITIEKKINSLILINSKIKKFETVVVKVEK